MISARSRCTERGDLLDAELVIAFLANRSRGEHALLLVSMESASILTIRVIESSDQVLWSPITRPSASAQKAATG